MNRSMPQDISLSIAQSCGWQPLVLVYCTFTGADEDVPLEKLAEKAEKFPNLELGISYNGTTEKMPRRPRIGWINDLHAECPNVHKALHLSNYTHASAVSDFANGCDEVLRAIEKFSRVQLNFFHLDQEVVNHIAPALRKQVGMVLEEHPGKQFILQDNKKSRNLLPLFDDLPKTQIAKLKDSSGGGGKEFDVNTLEFSDPDGFYGIAGGNDPINFPGKLAAISSIAPGRELWADTESGVRTDNKFDLDKMHRMAEIGKNYAPAAVAVRPRAARETELSGLVV